MTNFIKLSIEKKVGIIELNDEASGNLMGIDFWCQFPQQLTQFIEKNDPSCLVIYGSGEHFSRGLDLKSFIPYAKEKEILPATTAERREKLRQLIKMMQDAISILAQVEIPVIAAIHGECIGAGLDLASACDMRYASSDAIISLREARVSIVADVGSLQRLPYIIGEANTRELAFTAKDISAIEAQQMSLVTMVLNDKEALLNYSIKQAHQISKYSKQVLKGIKYNLNQRNSAQITQGLNQVASWNSSFLESAEFLRLVNIIEKRNKK